MTLEEDFFFLFLTNDMKCNWYKSHWYSSSVANIKLLKLTGGLMQLLLSTSTKSPDCWKLVGYTRERITLCIPYALAFFPLSICWGLLSETSSERGTGNKWKLQWCCLMELPSCCCVCQVLVPEGFCCVKSLLASQIMCFRLSNLNMAWS